MGLITLKDGALSCRWISGNRHISRRWHTQFQLNTSLRHYLVRTIVPQETAKRAPYLQHQTVRYCSQLCGTTLLEEPRKCNSFNFPAYPLANSEALPTTDGNKHHIFTQERYSCPVHAMKTYFIGRVQVYLILGTRGT